jgi:hypothetical protein
MILETSRSSDGSSSVSEDPLLDDILLSVSQLTHPRWFGTQGIYENSSIVGVYISWAVFNKPNEGNDITLVIASSGLYTSPGDASIPAN